MGLFSKHTPAPARDPRPKGTHWKDPGHVKMAIWLSRKENRRIEREAAERDARRESR
jgi:hypothetical protein